jgi:hypothetical protein
MLLYKSKFNLYLALSVLVTSFLAFLMPTVSVAATLYAIIVADTNDPGIGSAKDEEEILNLVANIAKNTGLTLNKTVIDDGAVSQGGGGYNKVKAAVEGLSVTAEDMVFFYYSGHGANKGTGSIWPELGVEGQATMPDRRIQLDWVKKTLEQKHPRLFIAMADACNVLPRSRARTWPKQTEEPSAYQKLFLGYQGFIVASSSIPDQYSFGVKDIGGLFTQAFLKSLNKALESSNPDWQRIMDEAIQPIQLDHHDQKVQIPQAKVAVTPVAVTPPSNNITIQQTCRNTGGCPQLTPPSPLLGECPKDGNIKQKCVDGEYCLAGNQKWCLDRSGKKRPFNIE